MFLPFTGVFHADFWLPLKYAKSSFQEHETPQNHILLNDIPSLIHRNVSSNIRIAHSAKSDWANRPWRRQSSNHRGSRNYGRYSSYRGSVRYGFQFFIDRRDMHYYYLNEQVFRPLSTLELTHTGTYRLMLSHTTTEYKVMPFRPAHMYLWPSAVKHMMKGDEVRQRMPTFIIDLAKRVEAHNQQAAAYTDSEGSIENQLEDNERVKSGGVTTDDLQDETRTIEEDVAKVRSAFKSISGAIEVGLYDVKADCCPTMFNTLRKYWLS